MFFLLSLPHICLVCFLFRAFHSRVVADVTADLFHKHVIYWLVSLKEPEQKHNPMTTGFSCPNKWTWLVIIKVKMILIWGPVSSYLQGVLQDLMTCRSLWQGFKHKWHSTVLLYWEQSRKYPLISFSLSERVEHRGDISSSVNIV